MQPTRRDAGWSATAALLRCDERLSACVSLPPAPTEAMTLGPRRSGVGTPLALVLTCALVLGRPAMLLMIVTGLSVSPAHRPPRARLVPALHCGMYAA